MPGVRRSSVSVEASRRWTERRAHLGQAIAAMRRRRRWTQGKVADRAGLGRGVVARIERGEARLDLEQLERLAIVFGVSLSVSLGRDAREDVADAGHLAMQELMLRLGRARGFTRRFELATKPAEP